MFGPGCRASLPPTYPPALTPIKYNRPSGTVGTAEMLVGSLNHRNERHPKNPTSVHRKTGKRSAATTPPLLKKSANEGCCAPAPLLPLVSVTAEDATMAPRLRPNIPRSAE